MQIFRICHEPGSRCIRGKGRAVGSASGKPPRTLMRICHGLNLTKPGKHREAFLQALDRVEAVSRRITYCGVSPYRLCGVGNGRESIRLDVWEWPEGFDTMLPIIKFAQHPNFEIFVTRWTPPGTVKTRKLVPRYGSRVYRPPTGCTKNVQFPVRR